MPQIAGDQEFSNAYASTQAVVSPLNPTTSPHLISSDALDDSFPVTSGLSQRTRKAGEAQTARSGEFFCPQYNVVEARPRHPQALINYNNSNAIRRDLKPPYFPSCNTARQTPFQMGIEITNHSPIPRIPYLDMPLGEPAPKRRRVSDTMSVKEPRRSSATSERPSTTNMSDEDDETTSPDPSDAQEFTIRRGYTFKRSGEPPKNADNKYVCKVDERCRGLTFDRKCEWG